MYFPFDLVVVIISWDTFVELDDRPIAHTDLVFLLQTFDDVAPQASFLNKITDHLDLFDDFKKEYTVCNVYNRAIKVFWLRYAINIANASLAI